MRSVDSIAFSFSSRRVGIDRPASYLLQQPATCNIAFATATQQHSSAPRYPMYTTSAVHVATTSGHVGENHLHASRAQSYRVDKGELKWG